MNIDGYYDGLLGLFDKGVEEGFISPSSRTIVVSATSAAELINKLEVLLVLALILALLLPSLTSKFNSSIAIYTKNECDASNDLRLNPIKY